MRCGIEVVVKGGEIKKITGLKSHPQNRGRLCPKGPAAIDIVYHPERLLKPLKKKHNGSFEEISLNQAMEEIADRLIAIADQYGKRAIASWHRGLGGSAANDPGNG